MNEERWKTWIVLCCFFSLVLIGIFGLLISEQKPKTNNPKSQLKRSELECTPNIWWRINAFFFSIRLISFFTSLQINRNEKKGVNDEEKDELNQTEQKWMMSEESTHYIHFVLFICLSSFIISFFTYIINTILLPKSWIRWMRRKKPNEM